MSYACALLITLVVEALLALTLVARQERPAVLLACLSVNALTHPVASFLLARGAGSMEAIEVAVLCAEALCYRVALGPGLRRALTLAFVCNGVTWGLSYLV